MPAHLHLAATSGETRSPRQASPIQVVLADDHATVRRSLRLLLAGERDLNVIAEASDLSAAVRYVREHVPHVLAVDVRVPKARASRRSAICAATFQTPRLWS